MSTEQFEAEKSIANESLDSQLVFQPYTQKILQGHLVQWEVQQQEALAKSPSVPSSISAELYERLVHILHDDEQITQQLKHPISATMIAGFTFGQGVLWQLKSKDHERVALKMAQTHNNVVEILMENWMEAREFGNEEALPLDQEVLERTHSDVPSIALRMEHLSHSSSFDPIITGCPAFYTPALKGLMEWIQEIRVAVATHESGEVAL